VETPWACPRRKHLKCTPIGLALALPSNSKTWLERVSNDKGFLVSNEGKKFYNIDTRKGSVQGSQPDMAHFVLECQPCERKFMTRTNLLMHLALCHFKTFLIKHFVRTADNSCSVCDKSFKHSKSILYHLAITHNALDDRLAKIAKRVPWKRPVTFSY